MKTLFSYILGGNLVLDISATVTPPTTTNLNCPMEDAEEPQGWEVEIISVELFDGSDFETDDISVKDDTLDELLEKAAIEAHSND